MHTHPTTPADSADAPSPWEDDPCRTTPIAVVLLVIAASVLGPLAAAILLAV